MLLRNENFNQAVAFRWPKSLMDRSGGLCVISRKENNHAKYVATRNQREFVAGNAAIIFHMFFPILQIADRLRVHPQLPTRDASLHTAIYIDTAEPISYIVSTIFNR